MMMSKTVLLLIAPSIRVTLARPNEEGVRAFIREAVGDAVPVHFRRVELFLLSSPMVARNDDGYGTMRFVFVKSKMIALTCSHVVSGYNHVGARSHPKGDIVTLAFGEVEMNMPWIDVALVRVFPGQHHTVNTVHFNFVFYDLVFREFDRTISQLRTFFMNRKVYKVGVMSGLTEGSIKLINQEIMMVKGDNESGVFAEPGDSGSLVFIKHNELNIVVGMLTEGNCDGGVCMVTGIWLFYAELMEIN